MNGSVDGSVLVMPWPIRTVARLLRNRILNGGMSPGFKLSRKNEAKAWVQDDNDIAGALDSVRQALHRLQTETKRSPHPAFGQLTPDEWYTFHLRHAELHMSFVVPA